MKDIMRNAGAASRKAADQEFHSFLSHFLFEEDQELFVGLRLQNQFQL